MNLHIEDFSMNKNDYSQAAEEMKEMLITEYLKKNPEARRKEITTNVVNGRIVIETVVNVIQNCSPKQNKKPPTFTAKESYLLKQLAAGGDERYAECLASIESSKKYVVWLHGVKFIPFGDSKKNEILEFLSKKNEISGKRSLDILNVKKQLIQLMKTDVKASKSNVQTMTMEYMQAVKGQLIAQGAIFNIEINLGNTFTENVEKFIKDNIRVAQPKLDKKSLIDIAKAYHVASNEKINPLDVPKKIDNKEFDKAIDNIKYKLDKLRKEFDNIQKLISFMEELVNKLLQSKDKDLSVPPGKEEKPGKSRPRMAFLSKGGRGR